MVLWFKNSIKRLNEKKEAEQQTQIEISELQDAIIEIADIVNDIYDASSKEDTTNG